ncbi:hypothetical protein GMRT_14421 [Giardia muris]|uniref:Uncharacterized protein n=1 Tax=Giardia muris TaxID=5742 RepID=A0A4Z1T102_GIAMU|nr:hypothetical protein GMRT_14421 [Giardia muris]|eukprot:TNJ27583.1 hypothetical protein GMRT_14421 [Giardia muris]
MIFPLVDVLTDTARHSEATVAYRASSTPEEKRELLTGAFLAHAEFCAEGSKALKEVLAIVRTGIVQLVGVALSDPDADAVFDPILNTLGKKTTALGEATSEYVIEDSHRRKDGLIRCLLEWCDWRRFGALLFLCLGLIQSAQPVSSSYLTTCIAALDAIAAGYEGLRMTAFLPVHLKVLCLRGLIDPLSTEPFCVVRAQIRAARKGIEELAGRTVEEQRYAFYDFDTVLAIDQSSHILSDPGLYYTATCILLVQIRRQLALRQEFAGVALTALATSNPSYLEAYRRTWPLLRLGLMGLVIDLVGFLLTMKSIPPVVRDLVGQVTESLDVSTPPVDAGTAPSLLEALEAHAVYLS